MTIHVSRLWRIALLALATLALVIALLSARSPASAQAPARTLTFTELEKGSTFFHIRNTKTKIRRANLFGDQDVFTNPLADASGKLVGKLHVACTTSVGSADFRRSKLVCYGVYAMSGGRLFAQAMISPGDETSQGAIIGGTGTYANARGIFTSGSARGGQTTTIALVN